MAGIFTRKTLQEIMSNEALTPEERTDQVFSLYGRALDDGYVTKAAAKAAQESAIEQAKTEWEKGLQMPDARESDEYKTLAGQFEAYKQMQAARGSADFADVKPKFFETVYGMVSRDEGAKPVKDQLAAIREQYDEYFTAKQEAPKPSFGSPDAGSMPKGNEGATAAFTNAWGFKK
jgi:type II secretory pathway pseudopilin PulG